jgi:hypothetical protein
MMIILKANKVNLFVSSVLCEFWYHSPNVLDTPHIWNISRLRVKTEIGHVLWVGYSVAQSVEALCYGRKDAGSLPDDVTTDHYQSTQLEISGTPIKTVQ